MSATGVQEEWLNHVDLPSILASAPKRPLHANVRRSTPSTTIPPGIESPRLMISTFVEMHLFLVELYTLAFGDGVPI